MFSRTRFGLTNNNEHGNNFSFLQTFESNGCEETIHFERVYFLFSLRVQFKNKTCTLKKKILVLIAYQWISRKKKEKKNISEEQKQ